MTEETRKTEKPNRIWGVLNSDLSRLLIGFILTTVVGTILVQWYQDRNWEKQRQFEVMKRRLDEGQKFIDELSDLVNLRVMQLRQVEGLLSSTSPTAREEVLRAWRNASETRRRWNVKLGVFQNKARRLISPSMGERLNNYETDNVSITDPTSVHGCFFVCNRAFAEVIRCSEKPQCRPSEEQLKEVRQRLNKLDIATDAFVDEASNKLIETEMIIGAPKFKEIHERGGGT
jgi:hypothetical protein